MPEIKNCVIIGQTGSGKTILAKSLVKNCSKVFILNDFAQTSPFVKTTWKDCLHISNCALVVEDIVNCSEDNFKKLQTLLNYKAHHNQISPIVLICHTAKKVNLIGLFDCCTHIFFTANKSNINSLKTVLNKFSFEKQEKINIENVFLNNKNKFDHFVLYCAERKFEKFNSDHCFEPSQKNKTPENNMEKLVKFLAEPDLALTISKLIRSNVNRALINENTCTLTLFSRKKNSNQDTNLIDYIGCLLTENEKPNKKFISLHKFVLKRNIIPRSFVKNKYLRKIR